MIANGPCQQRVADTFGGGNNGTRAELRPNTRPGR